MVTSTLLYSSYGRLRAPGPCAPCYITAQTSMTYCAYDLQSITVELKPLSMIIAGSGNQSTDTVTVVNGTVLPPNANVTDVLFKLPSAVTVTRTEDITCLVDGQTLTWPTFYDKYQAFAVASGQTPAASSRLSPSPGQPASYGSNVSSIWTPDPDPFGVPSTTCSSPVLSQELTLPSDVLSSSLWYGRPTDVTDFDARSIIPKQIVDYVQALPTIQAQLNGIDLEACSRYTGVEITVNLYVEYYKVCFERNDTLPSMVSATIDGSCLISTYALSLETGGRSGEAWSPTTAILLVTVTPTPAAEARVGPMQVTQTAISPPWTTGQPVPAQSELIGTVEPVPPLTQTSMDLTFTLEDFEWPSSSVPVASSAEIYYSGWSYKSSSPKEQDSTIDSSQLPRPIAYSSQDSQQEVPAVNSGWLALSFTEPSTTFTTVSITVTVLSKDSIVAVNSQTLAPGQAVSLAGAIVSLHSDGQDLWWSVNTLPNVTSTAVPSMLPLSITRSVSQLMVNGMTLVPGSIITVGNQEVSGLPNGEGAVVAGSTISIRKGEQTIIEDTDKPTSLPVSRYGDLLMVDGFVLTPNGTLMHSGKTISLNAKGTAVYVNGAPVLMDLGHSDHKSILADLDSMLQLTSFFHTPQTAAPGRTALAYIASETSPPLRTVRQSFSTSMTGPSANAHRLLSSDSVCNKDRLLSPGAFLLAVIAVLLL